MNSRLEWLQWRKGGIGGSDAPIIMGVSPWKTPLQLYEEKISDVVNEEDSFITQLGNEWEPKVRSLFELHEGQSFSPCLCESAGLPFLRASLDGRSEDKKSAIEIKLLGKEDWDAAKAGIVAEKYIPQIQHQLMVAGLERVFYLGYLYERGAVGVKLDKLAIVEVMSDLEYQKKMLAAEIEFWNCVVKRKPPLPSAKDYKTLRGHSAKLNQWKKLKTQIDALESKLEQVRKEIIEEAEKQKHPRFWSCGVRIRQESRIGNVNYKSIPELNGVDLEQYRGKGSISWKFEIAEEEK